MSDKTGNPILAFFGLDTGANVKATLGWVLPILVLPILGLAGMSYGLSLFIELPLMGHVAAIGGAASAPVVASYHRKELVPVAIILALGGYALGNYLGILAAYGCKWMM